MWSGSFGLGLPLGAQRPKPIRALRCWPPTAPWLMQGRPMVDSRRQVRLGLCSYSLPISARLSSCLNSMQLCQHTTTNSIARWCALFPQLKENPLDLLVNECGTSHYWMIIFFLGGGTSGIQSLNVTLEYSTFASQRSVLSQIRVYLMIWYRLEFSRQGISPLWMLVVRIQGHHS